MKTIKGWVPIIPVHLRIIAKLRDRRRPGYPLGELGWAALKPDGPLNTKLETLVQPLLDRRIIEDCSSYLGPGGKHFARVTDFGMGCQDLGLMPARPVTNPNDVPGLYKVLTAAVEAREKEGVTKK